MPTPTIDIDTTGITEALQRLNNEGRNAPQIFRSVMADSAKKINTVLAKEISAVYKIRQSDVKGGKNKFGEIKPVGNISLSGTMETGTSITIKGRLLTLHHFNFSPKQPGTRRRIKVSIMRAGGGSGSGNTWFVATTGARSADRVPFNVFRRVYSGGNRSRRNSTMEIVKTLSLAQMASNETVSEKVSEQMGNYMLDRFVHHYNRFI